MVALVALVALVAQRYTLLVPSTMQGAAAALMDSRTRRIVPEGECLCGEPPHLERVD